MDEYHRRSAAVAGDPVGQSRAIERRRVQRAIEDAHGSRRRRGRGFLGTGRSAAGDNQQPAQNDSHVYRMRRPASKRHYLISQAAAAATFCSTRHRPTPSPSAATLCFASLGERRRALPSSS